MQTLLLVILLVGGTVPPTPSPTPSSVAVLPLGVKGKARKDVAAVLDDLLLSEVQRQLSGARVIGRSDIDSMIGFEKTKEMVGCDQLSCMADIAGALGVDTIISGNIGQLGQKYVLSLAWIDQKAARVIRRNSGDLGRDENQFDVTMRPVVSGLISPGKLPDQAPAMVANNPDPSSCVPGAARQCQAECSAEVFSSCTILARMFIQGNGVVENAGRAQKLLEKACDGGNIDGCADLAGILERATDRPDAMARALRLYTLTCKGGDLPSCGQVGLAYAEGRGTPSDTATGAMYLEKACAGGLSKYCARLGSILAEGRGSSQDLTKALPMSRAACDGASPEGCYVLGSLLATEGASKDLASARGAFEKACAGGSRAGCQSLGLLEREGLGGPRALADADRHLAAACGGNQACLEGQRDNTYGPQGVQRTIAASCGSLGCLSPLVDFAPADQHLRNELLAHGPTCRPGERECEQTAVALDKGWGAQRDPARAAQIWQSRCQVGQAEACARFANTRVAAGAIDEAIAPLRAACEHGYSSACTAYGSALLVTGSTSQAATIYNSSCEQGVQESCVGLGTLYERGALPKDVVRATQLYTAACNDDNAQGCLRLGAMYESGTGLPKDDQRASLLYKRACTSNLATACMRLASVMGVHQWASVEGWQLAEALRRACDLGQATACR